jgi:squalene-hopene/tetraprenyl-beta-curcumene cyclase
VPFVLAAEAGDVRDRVLGEVRGRIEAWPDVDWWYDHDDAKIVESRGTEAVLNAFVVAGTDAAPRALDILFETQRADGGWDWLDFGLAPWERKDAELAGAAFAAIAVARTPDYRAPPARLDALRGFIAARVRAGMPLHDKLFVLWAATHDARLLDARRRAAFVADIVRVQRTDGGFALADLGTWTRKDGTPNRATASDGYATAFAAYVLGRIDRASPAVTRARRWLLDHQSADGSWPGVSMNDDDAFNRSLMTDAATAYAVLALQ